MSGDRGGRAEGYTDQPVAVGRLDRNGQRQIVGAEDGRLVAVCAHECLTSNEPEMEANARHMAAAWNAARDAGLSTAALEAGAVAKLVKAVEAQEAADRHFDGCGSCGYETCRLVYECGEFRRLQQEAASLRRAALALLREVPRAD